MLFIAFEHLALTTLTLLSFAGIGVFVVAWLWPENSEAFALGFLIRATFLGTALSHIASTVLLTYLPIPYATPVAQSFFFGGCLSGLWWLIRANKQGFLQTRATTKYLAILTVSFLASYVPFLSTTKPFLASEGSGDHTIYLGAAKFSKYASSESPVARARLCDLLTNVTSNPLVQETSWLKKALGWASKGFDPELRSDPFGKFESSERVILLGSNPGWWALPWLLLSAFGWLNPETLYMSLLFALNALVSLGMAAALDWSSTRVGIFTTAGLALLNMSAGFYSVGLNHYYPQLLSICALMGLYLFLLDDLTRPAWHWDRDIILLSTFCGASLAHYWVAAPWILAVVGTYLVFCLTSLGRRPLSLRKSAFVSRLLSPILWVPLLPHYFLTVVGGLNFFREVRQEHPNWRYFLGEPMRSMVEGTATALGMVSHTLLAPITALRVGDLLSGKVGPFVALSVLIVVIAAGWLLLGQSSHSFPESASKRTLYASATAALMICLILTFSGYAYTYNKAAFTSFPFLLIAALNSGQVVSSGLTKTRFEHLVHLLLLAILTLWGLGLVHAKAYQVASFWLPKLRSVILDCDIGLPDRRHTTRVYYYSSHNTSFSLLETLLAGRRPIAIGQLYFPSYKTFLSDGTFEMSTFVVPTSDPRTYRAVNSEFFNIGRGSSKVWPLSPFLDGKKSSLPRLIVLRQPSTYFETLGGVEQYLELYVQTREPIRLLCRVDSRTFDVHVESLTDQPTTAALEVSDPPAAERQLLDNFPGPEFSQWKTIQLMPAGDRLVATLVRLRNLHLVYLRAGNAAIRSGGVKD